MHAMLYAVGTEFAITVALVWLPTARVEIPDAQTSPPMRTKKSIGKHFFVDCVRQATKKVADEN